MSQHDMVVANGSGATVRADINDGLQALASTSKGTAAPSTIYAGQMWLDDDTPSSSIWTLNMYDGSGSIAVGYLDTSNNWFIPALGAGSASLPSIVFTGDTNTGLWSPGADIVALSTGGTERLRVTASGNVVIGGTAIIWDEVANVRTSGATVVQGLYSSSAAYNTHLLRMQTETAAGTGWAYLQGRSAGGNVEVAIYGNGNIQNTNNSYGAISDERLKEDIRDARSYLDDLMRVRVRKYKNKRRSTDEAEQLGIVAQELATVFPGLVEEVDDRDDKGRKTGTTLGVKYSILVPMLVTAVQDLQRQIAALETRLAAVEGA